MSDEKALLAAIWAQPHEDTPRLVYADWLDETGDPAKPARAEFIRIQCELARDPWDDSPHRTELQEREKELAKTHLPGWRKELPASVQKMAFRRGFVDPKRMRLPGAKFLQKKPADFAGAPVWNVSLTGLYRNFDKVFASPLLARVGILMIDLARYPHDGPAKLAECPYLRNVARFELYNATVTVAGLAKLLDAGPLPALRELDVTAAPGPEEVAAIANSPLASRLTALAVSVSSAGAGMLFSPKRFPRLNSLDLSHSGLDEPAVKAVVANPPGVPLRRLDLRLSRLADRGAELLAGWPGLAGLRWLDVNYNLIRESGYLALARSPHLGNLKYLKVNRVDLMGMPKAKAALEARFGEAMHSA